MKQGLSLRVSQHLALTPQLQQSIRLLQLSTLELGQEIQQMLDDNPFLELNRKTRARSSAPAIDDLQPAADDHDSDPSPWPATATTSTDTAGRARARPMPPILAEPNWDGDGSTETVPDDGEWGGDAPAPTQQPGRRRRGRRHRAGARQRVAAIVVLHRQALSLRLSKTTVPRCAS
jgi:RNA polymerase sigma-54 factor